MASTTTYLTCAQTAKLLRKALKADFPGVKFSVRSDTYAGGASIRVRYTDGPLTETVKATTSLYEGATFDGMTDMKDYHSTLLTTDDGVEVVHMGADFIFVDRDISPARQAVALHEVKKFVGEAWQGPDKEYDISVGKIYGLSGEGTTWALSKGGNVYHQNAKGIARRLAQGRVFLGEECPGGDDSYCPGCGRWQGAHRASHLR